MPTYLQKRLRPWAFYTIPLNIHIGKETLKDGQAETNERFFQAQEMVGELPTVTAPTIAQFEQKYAEIYKRTNKILSLHVSKKLSDTMAQAKLGAEALMGRCSIQFLDTASILLGQGILVKIAAQAAQDGASIDDIVRIVRGHIPHVYTVLYVDTMDYLEQSGRIGQAQSILGTMMNIKPLLFMEDGEIIPMEKVKTEAKALDKLTEFVAEFDSLQDIIVFQRHKHLVPASETLMERLEQAFPDRTFKLIQYNPLIASLVGPAALGIVVYEGLVQF